MKNKDKELIDLLKENSRIPNVEIAKKFGITEGAVRSRIKKLVENGTIKKFTIEVSESHQSFAIIFAKARGSTKNMMSKITSLKLHHDAYEISGDYDGCLILNGFSIDEIDKKIDKIRKLREVEGTKTFVAFKRW